MAKLIFSLIYIQRLRLNNKQIKDKKNHHPFIGDITLNMARHTLFISI